MIDILIFRLDGRNHPRTEAAVARVAARHRSIVAAPRASAS
jgi:hypothetical protein